MQHYVCPTHGIETDWITCAWCDGAGRYAILYERIDAPWRDCPFCRGKGGSWECEACMHEAAYGDETEEIYFD